MSDLFISYASEDRTYVRELVKEFQAQGFTVWWDHHIEPGTSFDRRIEEALDDSLCVVVVWSEHSINSDWVRAEAAEGLARNVLIPILLDEVKPPLLFRQKQAISLVEWRKSYEHSRVPLTALIPSISSILKSYSQSQLPVSTQSTWVLGEVKFEPGNEKLAAVASGALGIALSYFEGAFQYDARRRGHTSTRLTPDQLDDLVRHEGLDGYINGEINGSDDALQFTLRIQRTGREPLVKIYPIDNQESLLVIVGESLLEHAQVIQGSELTKSQAMLDYLNSLEVEVEYLCHLAMQYDDDNQWEKSKESYQKALTINENSTHALQGLAVVCNRLGQIALSRETMGLMVRTMRGDESDRRRLFSRGLYQTMYNQDWDKAADEFESLVKLSPLDDNTINNLAVARFYQLRFDEARELSERVLQLYSYNHLLANAALYALYAGEFAEADRLADRILAHDGWSEQAALVRSLVFAERGDLGSAKETLRSLINRTDQQDSLLLQGLADFEMAARAWDVSEKILDEGILIDKKLGNQEHHARKLIMKAEVSLYAKSDLDLAKPLLAEAITLSDSTQTLATYTLLCVQFGINEFEQVNASVRKKTDAHGRSLSKLIAAIEAWFSDDLSVTTNLLKESTGIIDLWFIHFCAAHIYQKSELFLEARDEIQICLNRPGEAMCAMLDDLPTFRYLGQVRRFGY